jgi:hypothetical protein
MAPELMLEGSSKGIGDGRPLSGSFRAGRYTKHALGLNVPPSSETRHFADGPDQAGDGEVASTVADTLPMGTD